MIDLSNWNPKRKTPIERFESKIYYSLDGCWYWLSYLDSCGYGRFGSISTKEVLAHRVAYEIYIGPIGNFYVCHTCDHPSCVNPNHLFLGSQLDNVTDCIRKGRAKVAKGEKAANAKLSTANVHYIRENPEKMTQVQLGKKFNVGQSAISKIILNQTHIL
jgi:hypothetical protein